VILPLLFGLVIGLTLGLLGGGGSILAVPALVYGLGQPVAVAVPTSLLVVGGSAAAGAIPKLRAGQVRWRVALGFAAAGVAVSFVGAAVNRRLPASVVLGGFALLMIAVAVRMLRGDPDRTAVCDLHEGWRSCLPHILASGAGVGFLTGLFGVGGGFLIVPALVVLLGLPMPAAVGTSLLVIALNSAAGFTAYLGQVNLDASLAAAFTAGALAGSVIGGRLGARVDADQLSRWFAWLLFVVAGYVLMTTFLLDRSTLG
jgi:uncharacterized membrane protein YfcA